MFAVAFLTTQIGLATLEQREEDALVQKAEIFLDAIAGVVAPMRAAPDADAIIVETLRDAVTFKPTLRDEAVTFCCRTGNGSEIIITPQARGTVSETLLVAHMRDHADLPAGARAVALNTQLSKLLLVRAYDTSSGPYQIGGAFDVEGLLGERRANQLRALILDFGLAFIAAGFTFLVTRASLAPIYQLTRQLSGAEAGALGARPALAPETTEVGQLQRAIKRRLDEEEHRAQLIAEASEKERHTVLARLAAGLAHEVRNPLAGLMGAVSTLRRFGGDEAVRRDTLDLMDRGLGTIERVAASMLSTYRPLREKRGLTQADIDDLLLLIRPELKRKDVRYSATDKLAGEMNIDADSVRQLLLNLLLNACEAAPQGGAIGLSIHQARPDVEFRVTDNGPGLPDGALSVILDPDRSAVPSNKGLGLWLIANLIDELEGKLAVETRAGQGTTIRITLTEKPMDTETPDGATKRAERAAEQGNDA